VANAAPQRLSDREATPLVESSNLLVTTVALLPSCGAFLAYDVISSLVRNVSIEAQIIGSNTGSALLFDYPESAEDTLSALRASRNIVYAGIYTPDGRPLAEYWRDGTGKTPPLARNAIPQTENHFFTGDEVAVLHPIAHEGKPIGYMEELPALRIFTEAECSLVRRRLAACPIEGVTAHGGPSGPLQFDRLGSHPLPPASIPICSPPGLPSIFQPAAGSVGLSPRPSGIRLALPVHSSRLRSAGWRTVAPY